MPTLKELENMLLQHLALHRRPVAISFLDTVPVGVEEFRGAMPSGCSFWRLASQGRSFYTVPSDHYNCPIGSYTHNIALPENRHQELPQVLNIMSDIGYLRMEEVPGVAQLENTPKYIAYAPLGDAPVAPDVVLMSGLPGRLMLLAEAAIRADANSGLPLLARPTCMAIPLSLESGAVSSAGCIGNRVYTDIGDDELYTVVRGADLARIVQELETVVAANSTLRAYHGERKQQITVNA